MYSFCILKEVNDELLVTLPSEINIYPHFGFKLDKIDAFLRNRYIVELSLLLSKELEPPA